TAVVLSWPSRLSRLRTWAAGSYAGLKVQKGRLFTAGPVAHARGWASRKKQPICPCPNTAWIVLKRQVGQRLGSSVGRFLGHSTRQFGPLCSPFCSDEA